MVLKKLFSLALIDKVPGHILSDDSSGIVLDNSFLSLLELY